MDDDELPPNTAFAWMGYSIARGNDGFLWVTYKGINPMPGAACFRNIDQAKKGIAALTVAQAIADHDGRASELFWCLMELTRKD